MTKRIVFDTNVLVSAFTHYGGNEWKVLDMAKKGAVKLILSEEIFDEFQEVITRKKFGLSGHLVAEILALITEIAEIIVPHSTLDVISEDPSDNKFLECAIDGRAECIISGDRHLLDYGTYKGIQILKAKDFLSKKKD